MAYLTMRRAAMAAAMALAFAQGAAQAAQPETADQEFTPVATVNGEAISPAELQVMVGTVLGSFQPSRRSDIDNAQLQAREMLISNLALAQAALKMGLDKDPGVAGVLAYQRAGTLAKAYQRFMLRRTPLTDTEVEAEYKRGLVNGKAQEYKLAQIVMAQQGRAEEVIAKLKGGESFADMARIYSLDTGSATHDGELGWLRIDQAEEYPIVDAVTSLKPGEYTKTPVKGINGWYILKLLEAPRPMQATPTFASLSDDTKKKLKARATLRQADELVDGVMKQAVVTRAPDLRVFGAVDSEVTSNKAPAGPAAGGQAQ